MRAALVAAAVVLVDDVWRRAHSVIQRVALPRYVPEPTRLSLDEPTIVLVCGGSRAARWLGLLCVHVGPVLWLSLCFQLGELRAKLSLRQPRRLLLLGCMWDFSFGTETPPPTKMAANVARCTRVVVAAAAAAGAGLEMLLSR